MKFKISSRINGFFHIIDTDVNKFVSVRGRIKRFKTEYAANKFIFLLEEAVRYKGEK